MVCIRVNNVFTFGSSNILSITIVDLEIPLDVSCASALLGPPSILLNLLKFMRQSLDLAVKNDALLLPVLLLLPSLFGFTGKAVLFLMRPRFVHLQLGCLTFEVIYLSPQLLSLE